MSIATEGRAGGTARAILPRPDTEESPRREIGFGAAVAGLFFIAFLGWAAFAPLDAGAAAHGTLVVSGQRQTVQHRDGGVVGAILVREGQRVRQGQLLIRLAAAEVRAQERALSAQAIRLLAQRERLRAEELGRATLEMPREFADLAPEDREEAQAALKLQEIELAARGSTLAAQRDAISQRAAQAREQGTGYGRQAVAAEEQKRLLDEELKGLRPLAAKGFVSTTRLRALERARADLDGQSGQYVASVAQAKEAAAEARVQVLEATRSYHERAANDLREVETSLGELLPKLGAARDQLRRTEIRAPATGAVVGLTVFTPGGVIQAGQRLLDIVPERTPLRIEAQVSPADADDLELGQRTIVRFPGLHERALPTLEGRLTRFSADSLRDERSGISYYTAEVTISPEQLDLIRRFRGSGFSLRAGMPADILIPLRKRTALQYMLEPLTGAFWGSFREH